MAGARTLLEQVLATRRRVLGEEHPNTTEAAFGVMLIAHQQGDHDRVDRLIRSLPPAVASQLRAWLMKSIPSQAPSA